MRTFIEFHLIQNFAPSNLNRDDTGAPKDAIFGGHRRARVSSQCFKRSTRLQMREYELLPAESFGVRTKQLKKLLVENLSNRDPDALADKIESALSAIKLSLATAKDGTREKTQYSLFLGEKEIAGFASLIDQYWNDLATVDQDSDKKKRTKAAPPAFKKAAKDLLDGGKAVDVALFGRMIADLPSAKQHAACQVAHAISTHRVEREFDYFTAMDDKGGDDDTGADMIQHTEFNSATLYRYAAVDLGKLAENLAGDRELTATAIEAFAIAFIRAIPTGKQNAFAAQNAPDFVGVSVRHIAPLNLANAFEKPIIPQTNQSLTGQSVACLSETDDKLSAAYGDDNDQWFYLDLTSQWPRGKGRSQPNLSTLAASVREVAADALGV